MSTRNDIIDPAYVQTAQYGLVYSEILGWIDVGHAAGDDIRRLLAQMTCGENGSAPYYDVVYSQSMYKIRKLLGVGVHARWRMRKGTSLQQRHSIALAIMMRTAVRFETLQASFPFSWSTDSGYSAEDLVSDLLGFYRVIRPMNYFPLLKIVSKAEAYKRWDYYGPIGNFKNKLFKPLIFPDPSRAHHTKPYYGQLPPFMTFIQPYSSFGDDNVKIITNDGVHMNIAQQPMEKYP